MIDTVIVAHNGTGEKKVKAGERKDSKPLTAEECISKWGETTLCKLAWESHVINVQREIRGGGSGGRNAKILKLIADARSEKADGDSTMFDKLVELKVIEG